MFAKIFYILKFIKHNKKVFKKRFNKTENVILIENYNYLPSILAFSYFSNVLADIYKAKLIVYNPNFFNFKTLIKFILKVPFINNYTIFRSFNIIDYLIPKKDNTSYLVEELYLKNLKNLRNTKDILKLKFLNIKVGDLIYDEYLRKYNLHTIDPGSKEFQRHFYSMTQLFVFWYNYFDNNKVKAVIASHTVYAIGLMPRIAIYKNIKAYNMGISYAYSLSKKNYLRLSGFENYKKDFLKIKKLIKKDLIKISENHLNKRIFGKDSVSHNITYNLSFSPFKINKLPNKNFKPKEKILIASHCFTDAVHAYGNALFPDYYEWLNYLGKLSNKMDYEWIIKIHPSQYDRNLKQMNNILRKFKKFSLVEKNKSHNDIISENKILYVLTVYGSIGHEYPLFGIPVINASVNNPHQAYKFNYNPSSIKEYGHLIMNFKKYKKYKKYDLNKNKKEIFEYYYTRFLSDYYLMKNLKTTMNKLKKNYKSSLIYREWLKQFNLKLHQKRLCDYKKFIQSNKFRMYADNTTNNSNYLDI
jgi:hypothetical protein